MMLCPSCDSENSKVVDSRHSQEGVRRRRECVSCGRRFTTDERVRTAPLMVVKRDGRREEFSAEKLERSLRIACAKRPLEIQAISEMVADMENELHGLGKTEVESSVIGDMAIERLRSLDKVAFIRFASVYRDFQGEESFARELQALSDGREDGEDRNQLRLIPDGVPRRAVHSGERDKAPVR